MFLNHLHLAEGVGVEPTQDWIPLTVFKTAATANWLALPLKNVQDLNLWALYGPPIFTIGRNKPLCQRFSTSREIRTPIKGFGDPYATIALCPYEPKVLGPYFNVGTKDF